MTAGSAGPGRTKHLVADSGGVSRTVAVTSAAGEAVTVTVDGTVRQVDAVEIRPGTWSIIVAGKAHLVDLERRERTIAYRVGTGGGSLELEDAQIRRLAAAARRTTAASRGEVIKAPISGRVVKVAVAVGDVVAAGASVLVLEAMKMENELIAERGGTVVKIHRQAKDSVNTGDALIELA